MHYVAREDGSVSGRLNVAGLEEGKLPSASRGRPIYDGEEGA